MTLDQADLQLPYLIMSISFDDGGVTIQYAEPEDIRRQDTQLIKVRQFRPDLMHESVTTRLADIKDGVCALIDAVEGGDGRLDGHSIPSA